MHYSYLSKLKFYALLIFYKLTSFSECKNFQIKVFLNEFDFLLATLYGIDKLTSNNKKIIILKTGLGKFMIRDICADINIASPSFERPDLNELFKKIRDSLNKNHPVVFIDIGASFGKFTIAVGNRFKAYRNQLSILSFEPDPENFKLLKKNIRLNKLNNIKAFHTALSNKRTIQKFFYFSPMKQIVSFPTREKINIRTTLLSDYLAYIPEKKSPDVFIKIDVEGHEIEVLMGSKEIIKKYKNILLLIEDSLPSASGQLIQYLSHHGNFLTKITSYNSFWKLQANDI